MKYADGTIYEMFNIFLYKVLKLFSAIKIVDYLKRNLCTEFFKVIQSYDEFFKSFIVKLSGLSNETLMDSFCFSLFKFLFCLIVNLDFILSQYICNIFNMKNSRACKIRSTYFKKYILCTGFF